MGCHALLQGIFLTQELNLALLHCRQIIYRVSHQGSSLGSKCGSQIQVDSLQTTSDHTALLLKDQQAQTSISIQEGQDLQYRHGNSHEAVRLPAVLLAVTPEGREFLFL